LTIELRPAGVRCNLACSYCYEKDLRAREIEIKPDVPAMIKAAKGIGNNFVLFGGEPLLAPLNVIEELFAAGATGLQTNGTLISQDHIRLFQKYRANVGISIDGPWGLNSLRCDEKTTNQVIENIKSMVQAGISVSLICVLHKMNAIGERLEKFKEFGLWAQSLGIFNINCHFMQGNFVESLDPDQQELAFLDLALWLRSHPDLRWQPFVDITQLLMVGRKAQVFCIFNACDPYTTSAVYSIEPDGIVRNCGRLVGNGPGWLKSPAPSRCRQDALAQCDQQYGGCKGCRFLPLCTGGCPGEAIDSDWRNRTEHCGTLKALFRFYEDALLDQGIVPASIRTDNKLLSPCTNSDHGDHGDIPHGDAPHGDHLDYAINQRN
jgi:uncharacterized protein